MTKNEESSQSKLEKFNNNLVADMIRRDLEEVIVEYFSKNGDDINIDESIIRYQEMVCRDDIEKFIGDINFVIPESKEYFWDLKSFSLYGDEFSRDYNNKEGMAIGISHYNISLLREKAKELINA